MERIADIAIAVFSVGVMLGIMILVHEWGHFVAAKFFGVRVDVFSIGFGPRLWGRKRGDTDYRISALPLGGYVKMAGDNPAEDRAGAPDEFLSKPRWQRAVIAVAGPAVNIASAVVLMVAVYMLGLPQPAFEAERAEVAAVGKGSPAEAAGIRAGDRIAELNGVANPTWGQVSLELQLATVSGRARVVVERNGQRVPLEVPLAAGEPLASEYAYVGYPRETVLVERVSRDMPADRAGLKAGDQIVAADGVPVVSRFQLMEIIRESGGRPLELAVQRGDAEKEMRIQLRPTFADPGDGTPRWLLGVNFTSPMAIRAYSFTQAVPRAVWFNVRMTRTILTIVGNLFRGKMSIKQLEGPVGIARHSGQAARLGLVPFLFLMAVISLNLGILNLLPIPILDGGHLLMLAIEGSIRRDLSLAVKERFVQAGLVFLLLIFAIVMYNDVLKLFTR